MKSERFWLIVCVICNLITLAFLVIVFLRLGLGW